MIRLKNILLKETKVPGDPQGVYLISAKQLGEAIMLKYNSSPDQADNWIRRSIDKADGSNMRKAYTQLYKCIQWTIEGNEYSLGSSSNDEFTVEDLGRYVQDYKDGFPELGQVVYDFLHFN